MKQSKAYFPIGYVCVGIILSQIGHIAVYNYSSTLQTWFNLTGLQIPRPSRLLVIIFSIWAATLFYFLGLLYYQKMFRHSPASIIRWGVLYWLAVVLTFQLPSSSLMRFIDESSLFMILILHVLITRIFLSSSSPHSQSVRLYRELWDILRILVTIALALPPIIGAGALITTFYKDAPTFTKMQLYRRVIIACYIEFGILALLIWPVFKQIIKLRRTSRSDYFNRSKMTGQV